MKSESIFDNSRYDVKMSRKNRCNVLPDIVDKVFIQNPETLSLYLKLFVCFSYFPNRNSNNSLI